MLEIETLKHLMLICRYYDDCARARKRITISETFTKQFFTVIDIILKRVYHVSLPNPLDASAMDSIESLYKSEPWS